MLARIAAMLDTPVVEDASGRLADGYHVGDLPWFVLNSSTGEILWRHHGWLSHEELTRQVGSSLAVLDTHVAARLWFEAL